MINFVKCVSLMLLVVTLGSMAGCDTIYPYTLRNGFADPITVQVSFTKQPGDGVLPPGQVLLPGNEFIFMHPEGDFEHIVVFSDGHKVYDLNEQALAELRQFSAGKPSRMVWNIQPDKINPLSRDEVRKLADYTGLDYAGADAACVKKYTESSFMFFTSGLNDAQVSIKEIDGMLTTGNASPYCFKPGKHRLGVYAYQSNQAAQDYVDLDFAAGRQYQLRAALRGISFVFYLLDTTSDPAVKAAEFKMTAVPSGRSTYVPMMLSRPPK